MPSSRNSVVAAPESNGDATTPEDAPLRSVSIAVSVLHCFVDRSELGATQIARLVGIAKSTASRMLATLASGGLLERGHNGRYRLGLRMFEYGQLAIDRLMLRELALPILVELRDTIGETVQLGVPLDTEVLYIDRLEGTHSLRYHTDLFRRVPGHSSSSGKSIAAFNRTFAETVLAGGLTRRTSATIVDPYRYRKALAEVRQNGWACSCEEFEVGLSSLAAPVVMSGGEPAGEHHSVAAISVAGPTQRVLGSRREAMIKNVCLAAGRLSSALERART